MYVTLSLWKHARLTLQTVTAAYCPTCITGNSDVIIMFTAVYTPHVVCTLINVSLCTVTYNVVQPNLSTTGTVDVVCLRSDIPDNVARGTCNNRSTTDYRQCVQLVIVYAVSYTHLTLPTIYSV